MKPHPVFAVAAIRETTPVYAREREINNYQFYIGAMAIFQSTRHPQNTFRTIVKRIQAKMTSIFIATTTLTDANFVFDALFRNFHVAIFNNNFALLNFKNFKEKKPNIFLRNLNRTQQSVIRKLRKPN